MSHAAPHAQVFSRYRPVFYPLAVQPISGRRFWPIQSGWTWAFEAAIPQKILRSQTRDASETLELFQFDLFKQNVKPF